MQIVRTEHGTHITSRTEDSSGAQLDWAACIAPGMPVIVSAYWPATGREITAIFGDGGIAWLRDRNGARESRLALPETSGFSFPGDPVTPAHDRLINDIIGLAHDALRCEAFLSPSFQVGG